MLNCLENLSSCAALMGTPHAPAAWGRLPLLPPWATAYWSVPPSSTRGAALACAPPPPGVGPPPLLPDRVGALADAVALSAAHRRRAAQAHGAAVSRRPGGSTPLRRWGCLVSAALGLHRARSPRPPRVAVAAPPPDTSPDKAGLWRYAAGCRAPQTHPPYALAPRGAPLRGWCVRGR